MQIFHCTQKLIKAFELPIQAPPGEPGNSPLGIWYANITVENDWIFLLFVNDPTLYTVILPFSVIPDPAQVFKTFQEYLSASLASDGINKWRIHSLLDIHKRYAYSRTISRSMIGSMNDLTNIFLLHIDSDLSDSNQLDLSKIQARLNRMPQRKIGWNFSVESMQASLQGL
jgi:hypothetical protein